MTSNLFLGPLRIVSAFVLSLFVIFPSSPAAAVDSFDFSVTNNASICGGDTGTGLCDVSKIVGVFGTDGAGNLTSFTGNFIIQSPNTYAGTYAITSSTGNLSSGRYGTYNTGTNALTSLNFTFLTGGSSWPADLLSYTSFDVFKVSLNIYTSDTGGTGGGTDTNVSFAPTGVPEINSSALPKSVLLLICMYLLNRSRFGHRDEERDARLTTPSGPVPETRPELPADLRSGIPLAQV